MMNMADQQVPLNQAVNFDDDDDEVKSGLYNWNFMISVLTPGFRLTPICTAKRH